MDRAARFDIERKACAPDTAGGFHFTTCTITRNLELRHGGALRCRERISKFQRGTAGSLRKPGVSTGNDAACSNVCRASAASASSIRRCAMAAGASSGESDGNAMDWALGSEPRNGGGGTLVRAISSPSAGMRDMPACSCALSSFATSSCTPLGNACSTSCSAVSPALAAAARFAAVGSGSFGA